MRPRPVEPSERRPFGDAVAAARLVRVVSRLARLVAAALCATALAAWPAAVHAQPEAPEPPPEDVSAEDGAEAAPAAPEAPEQPEVAPAEPAPAPAPAPPDTWGSGKPHAPGASQQPPTDGASPAQTRDQVAPSRPAAPPWRRMRPFSEAVSPVRYTLEKIIVKGNTRTRPRVILRYIPFRAGDVIDVDDPEVTLTRYRLLGTGFFRDVQFSLRKGTRPGHVLLVIEVVERNTVVVNDLRMGLSADADTEGDARPLTAYAGLGVAETNLAGSGMTLGSNIGLAQDQFALRVRFLDPAFVSTRWMTSGSLLYTNAQDFFGNSDVHYQSPAIDEVPDFAVVDYKRFGGTLGLGRDLSVTTQLWLHYRLESIEAQVPVAASHVRGRYGDEPNVEPIEFYIEPGRSVLSALRATLQYDSRDQPFLPTNGWFSEIQGEFALPPAGSDYDYQRFEVHASRWWELPWRHVLRFEVFGGAISGDAPFFELYYIGDFSDFLAGRVLQLNFDRRPPPNFLGTAIAEVRRGHYAGKLSAEYRVPLYRGTRSVYGIDLFTSAGIWGMATRHDLEKPVPNYSGAALIPVDLTANLGVRMDTSAGGFTFAFSNVLGFVPVRGENE